MASIVDDAMKDGTLLASIASGPTATTVASAGATPNPLTTARVGRAIYGVTTTPGTALFGAALNVSVTF